MYLHQPNQMWFENDSGDRLDMLFVWDQVMLLDWTMVEDRTNVVNCTSLGR